MSGFDLFGEPLKVDRKRSKREKIKDLVRTYDSNPLKPTSVSALQLQRPLAFFDLETTGVDVAKDRIIEIAIIKVLPSGEVEKYHQVCNPGMPIPAESSAVHGFTDEAVKDKPLFAAIAMEVSAFLEDCDFGGFNSNKFDVPMLVEELLRCGIDIQIETRLCVDVQRIFHKMERRTLEAAYLFYCGKKLENAHSAMADIEATYEVLLAQLGRYSELQNDVSFLAKYSEDNSGKIIDMARRFVERYGKACFNFGKYKDMPVEEVLRKDPGYYKWFMEADFPLHSKAKLKELKNKMIG